MGLFLMAFNENLNAFFNDFKVDVFYDNETYEGILEQPDEIIADGVVLTTDYELIAKSSDLGSLNFDEVLEIDEIKYRVRNARKIDDGNLTKISLMKV
tara:strand:- start:402 stop:695 length:294 start_codon:yes stop_codon:yes gene_type:complete